MASVRPPGSPPEVRVVMMQRDEGAMLERWVRHYSALFGWSNLTIFDNGSTDPRTLATLLASAGQGADVRMGFDAASDFEGKHVHIGNVIRSWDADVDYDFALPVDCDEMLAVFAGDGLTIDADAIRAELRRLSGVQQALRIDMSLFNVPSRRGWYCPDRHFVKSFLPARTFGSLDHGFHEARSAVAEGYAVTRLTYLHHHNKPLEIARQTAIRKLGGRFDVTDPEARAAYAATEGAPGAHLVPLLTMTEEGYSQRYSRDLLVHVSPVPNNTNLLCLHGKSWSWQPQSYLEKNPDVARLYGLGSLHHYLRHGFAEGRQL